MVDFNKLLNKNKKNPTTIDIESDAPTSKPSSAKDLAAVQRLAEEMRGIESWMDEQQRLIKDKSERYAIIQNTLLPDLMTQVGMSQFTLVTGETISIKDVIRGSIPSTSSIESADGPERAALEKRREDCLEWLKKNKAESLIKTELVAEFGKGQGKAAEALRKQIIKSGYPATVEQTVNFQTLNAFLRQQIASGIQVPEETFALFNGKQAKLDKAKKKKPTS